MPKVLKRANEHGGTGVVGFAGAISQATQMLLIYLLGAGAIPFIFIDGSPTVACICESVRS